MDKIAVLIPCFNEARTIEKVINNFQSALPEAKIYMYDNNSTDGTDELAKKAGAIVRYEKKQGKGNVIHTMFQEVEADCYIITDGDDTYPAEYARKMCKEVLENGADMVIGDRLSSTYFDENKRLFHGIGNIVVKKMINSLFHSDITDVMTGYRAFSRRFVKTFPASSHGFEIETEMTIHTLDKGLSISNVIMDYRDRPNGSESKVNTIKDGMLITNTIFKMYKKYKPFRFYSLIALIIFIIGIISSSFGIIEFYEKGFISHSITILIPFNIFGMSLLLLLIGSILQLITDRKRIKFLKALDNYKNVKNNLNS